MKFDWETPINGLKLLDVRNFARRHFSHSDNLLDLARIYSDESNRGANQEVSELYIKTMAKLGYIIIRSSAEKDIAQITEKGIRFMLSSPKRYLRGAAEKQLKTFITRCQQLNEMEPTIDTPESLAVVEKVYLFGSYLGDEKVIGDVDLRVVLKNKPGTDELRRKIGKKLFRTYPLGEVLRHDPLQKAMRYLTKGLTILSLLGEIPDGAEAVVIFEMENNDLSGGKSGNGVCRAILNQLLLRTPTSNLVSEVAPCLMETRSSKEPVYRYEMTDDDHCRLRSIITRIKSMVPSAVTGH